MAALTAPGHQASSREPTCYNCGLLGHWMMSCPEPTRKRPAGLEKAQSTQPGQNGFHDVRGLGSDRRSTGPVVTHYAPPPPHAQPPPRYGPPPPPPPQHAPPPPPGPYHPSPGPPAMQPYAPPYDQSPQEHQPYHPPYGPPRHDFPPPGPPPYQYAPTPFQPPPPHQIHGPGFNAAPPQPPAPYTPYLPYPLPLHQDLRSGPPQYQPNYPHSHPTPPPRDFPPRHEPPQTYGPPHPPYPQHLSRPPDPTQPVPPPKPSHPPRSQPRPVAQQPLPGPSIRHIPPPTVHALPAPPPPPAGGFPAIPPAPSRPPYNGPPAAASVGSQRPNASSPAPQKKPVSNRLQRKRERRRQKLKERHGKDAQPESPASESPQTQSATVAQEDDASSLTSPAPLQPTEPVSSQQKVAEKPGETNSEWTVELEAEFQAAFAEVKVHRIDEVGIPLSTEWSDAPTIPPAYNATCIKSAYFKEKDAESFSVSCQADACWESLSHDPAFERFDGMIDKTFEGHEYTYVTHEAEERLPWPEHPVMPPVFKPKRPLRRIQGNISAPVERHGISRLAHHSTDPGQDRLSRSPHLHRPPLPSGKRSWNESQGRYEGPSSKRVRPQSADRDREREVELGFRHDEWRSQRPRSNTETLKRQPQNTIPKGAFLRTPDHARPTSQQEMRSSPAKRLGNHLQSGQRSDRSRSRFSDEPPDLRVPSRRQPTSSRESSIFNPRSSRRASSRGSRGSSDRPRSASPLTALEADLLGFYHGDEDEDGSDGSGRDGGAMKKRRRSSGGLKGVKEKARGNADKGDEKRDKIKKRQVKKGQAVAAFGRRW